MQVVEALSERTPDDAMSLAMSIRPSPTELTGARRQLHLKAIVIAALAAGSYWSLIVPGSSIASRVFSAIVMVVALTAAATCVFHDGNHASFSTSRTINRLAGYTGDLLGASSWIWKFKHNNLHHGNTNIVGVDADIDQAPFARLAPDQPWHPWHRYQHLYMWILYGFLTLQWFLISDFLDLKNRGINRQRFPRQPRPRDIGVLALGKALHVGWAIALPLVYHEWWVVLVFYLAISWSVGLLLATMFQLAHCTELAEFPSAGSQRRGPDFVEYQLRTTVDVHCRTSLGRRSMQWLMGGLDFQVEHHLAPRLPHTAYPLVAERLDRVCADLHVAVRSHATPWQAIRSHGRWLKLMGTDPDRIDRTSTEVLPGLRGPLPLVCGDAVRARGRP
jgi:linoleoyl-CoA desaturase